MTHRGPFQPLLFCDSVIRAPDPLRPGAECGELGAMPGAEPRPRRDPALLRPSGLPCVQARSEGFLQS